MTETKQTKICSKCGDGFLSKTGRHGSICRVCKNKKQRELRASVNDAYTKKYEKTKKGFIMRMYRNMKSRVTGVQKHSAHLYLGKDILSKEQFYRLALNSERFNELFEAYEKSGFDRKLSPTPDRIKATLGYIEGNIQFATLSENCRRVTRTNHRYGMPLVWINGQKYRMLPPC